MLALARTEDLAVEELGAELLVYDRLTHKTHCLGPAAAAVWRRCNGETTADELAVHLKGLRAAGDEEAVWLILHRLSRLGLLETAITPPAGTIRSSRREMAKKVLAFGGMAGLLAITMAAPTAAQAASTIPTGPGVQ